MEATFDLVPLHLGNALAAAQQALGRNVGDASWSKQRLGAAAGIAFFDRFAYLTK